MTSFGTQHLRSSIKINTSLVQWWRPLISAVITFGLTVACIGFGHPEYAVPVAIGSWFAGITDSGDPIGVYWRAMAWTTAFVTFAATLGSLVSNSPLAQLIVVALMALACGFVGCLGPTPMTNGIVTLVVYSVFAGQPAAHRSAFTTGLLILLGGITCILITVGLYALARSPGFSARPVTGMPVLGSLRSHLHVTDSFVRHSVRLAVVMIFATGLAAWLDWPHHYWIPMTVAWIARPARDATVEKVVHRMLGTLVGILLAVLLINDTGMNLYVLAVISAVGIAISLIFLRANYPIAVVGLTLAVIALFAIDGEPVDETAPYRVAATLLAGMIALLGTFIWPSARSIAEQKSPQ